MSGFASAVFRVVAPLVAVAFVSCAGGGAEPSVQLDPEGLDAVRDYAMGPETNTQGVVILQQGEVVAEWYASDRDADSWATSWSVAKSFTGTLIGIALYEGLVSSLDEPMTTYIPEWVGTDREGITLRHVMSMSTGFLWNEWDGPVDDVLRLGLSADQLGYALDQTVGHPPGEVWNYSSGTNLLLTRVISSVTDENAGDYARTKLFEPLGFERAEWWQDVAGNTIAYCCIDATTRDFAKLGQLYLQNGVWDGERIFAEDWVSEVTKPHQEDNLSYGLTWWLNSVGGNPDRPNVSRSLFYAQGYNGQYIYVFPDEGIVVARNGLFVRPEGEPVATAGLAAAGMLLDGLGETGTLPVGANWDPTVFLELITDAMRRPDR